MIAATGDSPATAVAPLVSVVIPARNAAATLERAVRSVLEQDWRPLEVIVTDDASVDATAAIAESFAATSADVPVRVLHLSTAHGAAGARNAAIAAARGEIIAFQDADDEWLPGKLTRQVALLRADPRLVFVACGTQFIAPDGRDLGPLYGGRIPQPGGQAWRALLAHNTIATPSVIVWSRDLHTVGGFDTDLRIAEDQDMWLRLSMRGHLGYVDAPLIRVHAVADSLSGVGMRRGYQDQVHITIPMVQRHLASKRNELTRHELRRILGERWSRVGRAAYSQGGYGDGLKMVLRGILLGYRPMENLLFLLSAAPPTRWVKRRLGIGRP